MKRKPIEGRPRRAQTKGAVASGRTTFTSSGNSGPRSGFDADQKRRARRIHANSRVPSSNGGQKPRVRGISVIPHSSGRQECLKASRNVTNHHAIRVATSKALRNSQSNRRRQSIVRIADHSLSGRRLFGAVSTNVRQIVHGRGPFPAIGRYQQNSAVCCGASRPNPARKGPNPAAKPLKGHSSAQAMLDRGRSDA